MTFFSLQRSNERDIVKQEREEKMAPVVAILRAADFDVETVVIDGDPVDGDPVEVTTDLARDRNADMIVTTKYRGSSLVNLLEGKTAQRSVRHALCPVLTVHTS